VSTRPDLVEQWEPGRSVPVASILGALRRGSGDPTMVVRPNAVWWGVHTPAGPAATWWQVEPAEGGERVILRAYGAGAAWFAGRLPTILGEADSLDGFAAHHEPVKVALRVRQLADWRIPRTGLVITSLVPSILEQKVTGRQAFAGFRHLVRMYGTPVTFDPEALRAAGPQAPAVARLMAAPSAAQWRRIPSWEWLQAGVEPPQSRTVMRALEHADRLEQTSELPIAEAHARLRLVPGIGVWTAAKVAQSAWGDPDAPTFADYHVAKEIGHALLGRDIDDVGMAGLLEPYRGHRYRAERLILAAAPRRERHGARMTLPSHLPQRAWR
jgi:3-methyladenine DNA glycosylase/8-oxoguanine DNA glycosylase